MIAKAPIWVLRPEPGNAATCARLREMGHQAIPIPLFVVESVPWDCPEAAGFDALLLTSANAVRHAGEALAHLSALPTYAVGAETAKLARAAGLSVVAVGSGGVGALAERLVHDGRGRILHLTGRDFTALPKSFESTVRIVYAAHERATVEVLTAIVSPPSPAHVLLHSARAARRFADLVSLADRAKCDFHLHAMSQSIADSAGLGWASVTVADVPNEAALLSGLPK